MLLRARDDAARRRRLGEDAAQAVAVERADSPPTHDPHRLMYFRPRRNGTCAEHHATEESGSVLRSARIGPLPLLDRMPKSTIAGDQPPQRTDP